MALIQISNLNSATSTATDSFLTELQATDSSEVFGGSGDKGYGEKKNKGYGEKKNKGEDGGYGGYGGYGGEHEGEGGEGGYGHYPAPIHYNPYPVYYPSHH